MKNCSRKNWWGVEGGRGRGGGRGGGDCTAVKHCHSHCNFIILAHGEKGKLCITKLNKILAKWGML